MGDSALSQDDVSYGFIVARNTFMDILPAPKSTVDFLDKLVPRIDTAMNLLCFVHPKPGIYNIENEAPIDQREIEHLAYTRVKAPSVKPRTSGFQITSNPGF